MIDKNTPACDMTIGGNIYKAGNAREFKTGDWRRKLLPEAHQGVLEQRVPPLFFHTTSVYEVIQFFPLQ